MLREIAAFCSDPLVVLLERSSDRARDPLPSTALLRQADEQSTCCRFRRPLAVGLDERSYSGQSKCCSLRVAQYRLVWSNGIMTVEIVDPYDRRAYERLQTQLNRGPSFSRRASGRFSEAVSRSSRAVVKPLPISLTDGTEKVFRSAFSGLRSLLLDPAMRSESHRVS